MKLALSTTMFAMLLAPAVFGQTKDQIYDQRNKNQDNRIADGVKSGKLDTQQAARLDANRAAINHEVRHDAIQNGGHLTNGEKTAVQHQVKAENSAIYHKKNVNPKGPAQ